MFFFVVVGVFVTEKSFYSLPSVFYREVLFLALLSVNSNANFHRLWQVATALIQLNLMEALKQLVMGLRDV